MSPGCTDPVAGARERSPREPGGSSVPRNDRATTRRVPGAGPGLIPILAVATVTGGLALSAPFWAGPGGDLAWTLPSGGAAVDERSRAAEEPAKGPPLVATEDHGATGTGEAGPARAGPEIKRTRTPASQGSTPDAARDARPGRERGQSSDTSGEETLSAREATDTAEVPETPRAERGPELVTIPPEFPETIGPEATHYLDGGGTLRPIDTTIRELADGSFDSRENSLALRFEPAGAGKRHGAGSAVSVTNQRDQSVRWTPLGVSLAGEGFDLGGILPPGRAAASGRSASSFTYTRSYPATDEVYKAEPSRIKHEFILSELPAMTPEERESARYVSFAGTLVFSEEFRILEDGTAFAKRGSFATSRSLHLVDAQGRTAFVLPAPFAYECFNPEARADCRYLVLREGSGLALAIQAPIAWLASPERTWPIVVDPTFKSYEPASGIGYFMYDGVWPAQSFKETADNYDMDSVELYIADAGADDSITVEIQSDDNGRPSGVVLASPVTVNSGSAYAWVVFTFPSAIRVIKDRLYWIVAKNTNLGATDGYQWRGRSSVPLYAYDKASSTSDGASWTTTTTSDNSFRANGNPVATSETYTEATRLAPATLATSESDEYVGTFSFASIGAPNSDVTQIVLSLAGTVATSDVSLCHIHTDTDGVYNRNETQVGTGVAFDGAANATFDTSGNSYLSPAGGFTGSVYVHVAVDLLASADTKTLGIEITSAADVTDPGKTVTLSSAPPPVLGTSTV